MNPLDREDTFYLSLANPNPSSSKTKDGPVYRVSFELSQDEWQMFMDATTKGMIVECACQVTHRNNESVERDPNTVDLVDGVTGNEKKKGGPLSIRAARLSRDSDFIDYIRERDLEFVKDFKDIGGSVENMSDVYVRQACGVESRAEIDHDDAAKAKFQNLIKNYTQWSMENNRG